TSMGEAVATQQGHTHKQQLFTNYPLYLVWLFTIILKKPSITGPNANHASR
ncbi:unnamed protein product, partial [Ceratitis capitata]